MLKTIDATLHADMRRNAAESPRGRTHHNFHPTLEDPVQRLCMVMNRGTYVRPHRHTDPGKFELFIALEGRLAALIFDETGKVLARHELAGDGELRAIEIPPETWHALVVLSDQAWVLEVKPGPYQPTSDKDFAAWAPQEGEPGADEMVARYETARVGDSLA